MLLIGRQSVEAVPDEVEEADDDLMSKSLISIRDVWIDIANECELRAGRRVKVRERELDPLVARVLELGAWVGAASTGTDEVTADDPATRDVIRRAATRSLAALAPTA